MKICEFKICDMQSIKDITQALLLNGYEIKLSTIYKHFPKDNLIDYFVIEVFKHS